MKNKRDNYFRELAGLRVVSMYVQEFFRWGWQQLNQQNDDGIDGYVIVRDKAGKDLGCNIRVQIKSGPSYLSGRSMNGKQVTISPYASSGVLQSHMQDYARSIQPVIMVWVNTSKKDAKGNSYEDFLNPEAWWERVDNYPYKSGSVLTLTHKFGEHSKGDWFDMVKPLLKNWLNHPLLVLQPQDKSLYYSLHLKQDAKAFYREWQQRDTHLVLGEDKNTLTVKKTRTGWRHINYARRGKRRVSNSLRLLSVAEHIILTEGLLPVFLGDKDMVIGSKWLKYGLRARVQIENDTILKVQVVVLMNRDTVKLKRECQFFSVHVIK